jgi:hypothetical protein
MIVSASITKYDALDAFHGRLLLPLVICIVMGWAYVWRKR